METIIIKPKVNIKIKKIELSIFDGVFINMKIKYDFYGILDLEKIKKSLSNVLEIYPFIGGKIINDNNNYSIDISNPMIKLIINNNDNISSDNNFLFIVSLSRSKNITILELHINHVIGDGKTINNILKTWSDLYQEKYIKKDILIERYNTISNYKYKMVKIDNNLHLYKTFNKDIEFIINSPKLYKCIIEFNKKEIEILKNISNSYSSLDSLSSYLYNVCNSIENEKKLEHVCTSIDFRKKINIDLDTIGNYVIVVPTNKITNKKK